MRTGPSISIPIASLCRNRSSHCRFGLPALSMRGVPGAERRHRRPNLLLESPRQSGPQYRHRPGPVEAGPLRVQEQLRPANFGKFQRAVPSRNFQHIQSREFRLANRQPCRSSTKTACNDSKRWTPHGHANHFPPDSVCAEIDLVSGTGFLLRTILKSSLWGLVFVRTNLHKLKHAPLVRSETVFAHETSAA